MKYLVFVTDGKIDIRSFMTFGFNAKPNTSNPIGFFGTGLKISTAVIARLGCKMTVLIDGVQHEFYTKKTEFRGKEFNVVRMRKRKGVLSRWYYQEMPYTTELGKNWEPWQVFRELESNTRDENGHTFIIDEDDPNGMSFLNDEHRGKTVILVDEPSVIKAYEERDTIFLPQNLELRTESNRCQAFNVGSKYLYYRGMRVVELDRPSAFTYNIKAEQRLTEDRTLYSWNAQWEVRQLIMESTDKKFISEIIKLDEERFWEGEISFDDVHAISSETFRNVVSDRFYSGAFVMPRITSFHERYHISEPEDPDVTVTLKKSKWDRLTKIFSSINAQEVAEAIGRDKNDVEADIFEIRDILRNKENSGKTNDAVSF